jgi:hypothetical protein
MKIGIIICFLLTMSAVFAKKNKKIIVNRPIAHMMGRNVFGPPRPVLHSMPVRVDPRHPIYHAPVSVGVLPSSYATFLSDCPLNHYSQSLIQRTSGACYMPCSISTCVQTTLECCHYGNATILRRRRH